MLLWNTTICVYSCIFIPTNTYSYTYINVKYLQFVTMEFSSLSVIRNRKGFLLLLFLFFLLPKFPILGSPTSTHLPIFSPPLTCITFPPFNKYLTGNLLWSSHVWREEGVESGTEEIYPANSNVPAKE